MMDSITVGANIRMTEAVTGVTRPLSSRQRKKQKYSML